MLVKIEALKTQNAELAAKADGDIDGNIIMLTDSYKVRSYNPTKLKLMKP